MKVGDIIRYIVENTLETGFPVPAPRDVAYRWALNRNIPRRGRVYLYTGALYQLVPYIDASVKSMERFGRLPGLGKAARLLSRTRLTGIAIRPRRELIEWSERVVASIASLAVRNVEGLAYLYEDDRYSGVLLYEIGAEDAFLKHASRVYAALKERGVEKLITIDPHTTYVMRDIYPKFIDGYDIDVVNYLEVMKDHQASRVLKGKVTIHDPCLYARTLNILEEPRRLLASLGYEIAEAKRSRENTYCCGGPVEAFSPKLSLAIARDRLRELASTATTIVTLCPICYLSLSRARENMSLNITIKDIAELLG
ncbi:MAG: (Fe-S)-binding protein [Hyperthermus sp.]|nr:MAG: (Fe-S)-binding protein [Hyperthermus sp.]